MNKQKQLGFSLIEIMVVVVILGILAELVVPKIIGRPDEARVVKAKHDILTLENALELYQLDNGFYPSTEQGLHALVQKPSSDPMPQNWKAYLKSLPKDPWGRDYVYMLTDGQFTVLTYGADGVAGGSGINNDISNWNINN